MRGCGDPRNPTEHDLAGHRDVACFTHRGIEPAEQPLDRAGLGQLLSEQPDRPGIRDAVFGPQPEEAHERQPAEGSQKPRSL